MTRVEHGPAASFMKNGLNAVLVDTNILVYVYDPRDRAKQDRAILVLDQLFDAERAVLSVQCLTEFFFS